MPSALRVGHTAHFVRWFMANDAWTTEVRTAVYRGRDAENWLVDVDGEPTTLRRSEWQECAP
jgi:hypothetical protein